MRNPRPCGSAYPRGALKNLFARELDSAPSRLGMSFPHKQKWLNENLSPLRRFLEKNIGRRWDAVRSEISAQLSADSAVQKHVLDHLADFVEEHVQMIDGVPHASRWGRRVPIFAGRYQTLYVCPRTGILRRGRRAPERPPAPLRVVVVDTRSEVWRIGAKLHTVRFRRLPPLPARDRCFDILLGRHMTSSWFGPDARLASFYGRADHFAFEMREPGRRELRLAERAVKKTLARSRQGG